jgi:hypothetical protein
VALLVIEHAPVELWHHFLLDQQQRSTVTGDLSRSNYVRLRKLLALGAAVRADQEEMNTTPSWLGPNGTARLLGVLEGLEYVFDLVSPSRRAPLRILVDITTALDNSSFERVSARRTLASLLTLGQDNRAPAALALDAVKGHF